MQMRVRVKQASLIGVLVVAMSASVCPAQANDPNLVAVSIAQLVATPERYDGRRVTVVGFLAMDHEANLLYLHKTDYDNVLTSNAVWVESTKTMVKDREKVEYKYVRIIGRFRAQPISMWVGRLTEIEDCLMWSDPEHPLLEERQGSYRRKLSPPPEKR